MVKLNILNKLSITIIAGIASFAIILGIYFDGYLKEVYFKQTKKKMEQGFSKLAWDVQKIESNLKSGISFVQNDETFIASIDLVNSYQNKNDYNNVLIDEEKKIIASKMLDKVKLSLNDDIALYDKNGELIAFVVKKHEVYNLNFISFENGNPIVYSKNESDLEYSKIKLEENKVLPFNHIGYNQIKDYNSSKIITYHSIDNNIYLKSHLNISDTYTKNIMAHIEMTKVLDKSFFDAISKDIDLQMSIVNIENKNKELISFGDLAFIDKLHIKQSDKNYFSQIHIKTIDGSTCIEAILDKQILTQALNENRVKIFFIIIVIALIMLVAVRTLFDRLLGYPFSVLMHQINKIEQHDYSDTKILQSNDELQAISQNVNNLALALNEREKQLKIINDDLRYFSNHDSLTGLPNRRYFIDELEKSINDAKTNFSNIALFFIDLDHFKNINDTLGHNVGDELLQLVSGRLLNILSSSATLARLGGDEFVVLFKDADNENHLRNIAKQILQTFQKPFNTADYHLVVSASIGISILLKDNIGIHTQTGMDLIKEADLAMYHAKAIGRNDFCFFSDELLKSMQEKTLLINALKEAIETEEEFILMYQPKISVKTNKIISVEALVRWNSKKLGFLLPDKFITIAEETNLIIELGKWILLTACRDFQKLKELNYTLEHISINISSVQLNDENLIEMLKSIISQTSIDPTKIELEITESFIATDTKNAIDLLSQIRNMGIYLAIDDFGTGYSSLSYLQKLPVTRLKIDKSFVDNLPNSAQSVAIVKSIITLAKTFGLFITAEGVENKEQLDFLVAQECEEIQGYYFSKPLSFDDLKLFIDSHQ